MSSSIDYVFVEGSFFEMGFQLGEEREGNFQRVLERYRKLIQNNGVNWEKLIKESKKYNSFIAEYHPHLWDELQGVSEGSGIELDSIACLYSFQEVLADKNLGCSSLALTSQATAKGVTLLAHNEDWLPEDAEEIYVLHARPSDGPEYLCMNYVGYTNQGLNIYGIGSIGNALTSTDHKVGIPRGFSYRNVLAQSSLVKALDATTPQHRAAGNNHLIGTSFGSIYDVEVSANHYEIVPQDKGYLVHTNHHLTEEMKKIQVQGSYFNSIVRYNRLSKLISKSVGEITVDDLKNILADHAEYPDSVCSHTEKIKPGEFQYSTIGSTIIDLTNGVLHVCKGPPCEGEYEKFKFDTEGYPVNLKEGG